MFKTVRSFILWTVGVVYMFFFLLLLILFSYTLPLRIYDPWLKSLCKLMFKLLFIRVKVIGTENVDPNKTYVFMGNHVSMFDIPLYFGYIPSHFQGMEASGHFKTPLYGWALRRYGNIPMDRTNPRASFKSLQQGIDLLKSGVCMTILPEGTRALQPVMGEFKKLPFAMPQKAGVGIIPIAFSGLWKINNKNSGHIFPGKLTISFGKEITHETIKSITTEELMELTRQRIQEMISEP